MTDAKEQVNNAKRANSIRGSKGEHFCHATGLTRVGVAVHTRSQQCALLLMALGFATETSRQNKRQSTCACPAF